MNRLPVSLLQLAAQRLAAQLKESRKTVLRATGGVEAALENAKPTLVTLMWLDEETLDHLQEMLRSELADVSFDSAPIVTAIVTSDDSQDWDTNRKTMRIDQAHEYRDKTAVECAVLLLLIPAQLETTLKRTGLDNPGSPIDLDKLWVGVLPELILLVREEMRQLVSEAIQKLQRVRTPYQLAAYVGAIVDRPEPDAPGRGLWRLDLIPDVGPDWLARLDHNAECVRQISNPSQPQANPSQRLDNCRFRKGAEHSQMVHLLARQDVNPALPRTWLVPIATEDEYAGLTFDRWPLELTESSLEAIHVKPFLKPNGTVDETATKLTQPHGANTTPVATRDQVRVSWTVTPAKPLGVSKWRAEIVPANPQLVGEIPDLPAREVGAASRSATIKLSDIPDDPETRELIGQTSFRVQVTALDELAQIHDEAGELILDLSDPFYIGEKNDVGGGESSQRHVGNVALARVRAAQQLHGSELVAALLETNAEHATYRMTAEPHPGSLEMQITTNPVVASLVEAIVSRADEPVSIALDTDGSDPLTPKLTLESVKFRSHQLPEALAQRRTEFLRALSSTPAACSLETIEHAAWSHTLDKRSRAYIRAYVDALDTASDSSQLCGILAADTFTLRITHRSKVHKALVLLPTHPLRAGWYARYDSVLADMAESLLSRPPESRRGALDLGLLDDVEPANFPLLSSDADGSLFVYNDRIGYGATVHLESGDPDPHATRSVVSRILGLPTSRDVIQVPPRRLADRIDLYLQTHPYVQHLNLFAENVGSGAFLTDALELLHTPIDLDTEHEGAKPLRTSVTAVDSSADTPHPIAQLRELQSRLHDNDKIVPGTLLSPAFELRALSSSPVDGNDEWNIAVTVDPGVPNVAVTSMTPNRGALFHSLITPTTTTFSAEDAGVRWDTVATASAGKTADRAATGLGTALTAHNRALSVLLGRPDQLPCLSVSLDNDDVAAVERLHHRADWVISLSRYSGTELLDSPADAFVGGKSRRYILDFSPDFHDGFGFRMTVSTEHRHELESILQDALLELGFGDAALTSSLLLDDLRSVSGRLALRLVEANNLAREAAGIAVVVRYLRQRGELDGTIIVPIDAHPEIFGVTRSRDINDEGRRCDLLLIRPKTKSFDVEFVEVKQRNGPVGRDLYDRIADQTQATERVVETLFFSPESRVDHALHRARLISILRSYLDRSQRHGHISHDERPVLEERLERLAQGYEALTATRTGYIVNLSSAPVADREHSGTIIKTLTEVDLHPTGLISAQTERSRSGSVTPTETERGTDVRPTPQAHVELATGSTPTSESSAKLETPEPEQSRPASQEPEAETAHEVRVVPEVIEVELGVIRGTETVVPWTLSTRGSPHLFMIGMPGQGKSWTTLRIVDELSKQGLPSLIFDYHGQFASELPFQLPVLDLADGLPFSPLDATSERGASNWKVNAYQVAEIFGFVATLGPIQRETVYQALLNVYQRHGFSDTEMGSIPSVREFFNEVQDLESGSRSGQNAAARLRPLLDFNLFQEAPRESIQTYFDRGGIFDLSQIPIEDVQRAGGSFLLRKLYRDMLAWGESDRLRLAVVLDEAHRLAQDVTLPKIMKEGRKFGIAVIVASQNINDFNPDVLQNAGSKIVFRLNIGEAKKAAGFVRGKANLDVTAEIENLPVGEAFVQTAEMAQARRVVLHPFR